MPAFMDPGRATPDEGRGVMADDMRYPAAVARNLVRAHRARAAKLRSVPYSADPHVIAQHEIADDHEAMADELEKDGTDD